MINRKIWGYPIFRSTTIWMHQIVQYSNLKNEKKIASSKENCVQKSSFSYFTCKKNKQTHTIIWMCMCVCACLLFHQNVCCLFNIINKILGCRTNEWIVWQQSRCHRCIRLMHYAIHASNCYPPIVNVAPAKLARTRTIVWLKIYLILYLDVVALSVDTQS